MKVFTLLLLIVPFTLAAQVFPFSEGFAGIPSNALPAGWTGDMKVRASHGLNYDKGLAADIGSTDMVDSAITPWIGPLDNNTQFYFWYQMVEELIYPSTEKHLTTDSLVISISTDSVNFTDLYVIDSSNHVSSLSFKRITFPISGYGGQVVKFKLRCKYGIGSSYFVDIDSVRVRVNPNVAIEEVNTTSVSVYPTLANSYITIEAGAIGSDYKQLELFNLCGQSVLRSAFENRVTVDVTPLLSGIYFVRLYSEEFVLTRKIIIQR